MGLSEEEKKAIEVLKLDLACTVEANECGLATKGEYDNEIKAYNIVFNLIDKLLKENEELKVIINKADNEISDLRQYFYKDCQPDFIKILEILRDKVKENKE